MLTILGMLVVCNLIQRKSEFQSFKGWPIYDELTGPPYPGTPWTANCSAIWSAPVDGLRKLMAGCSLKGKRLTKYSQRGMCYNEVGYK
jgi:hypothetical protein